jgi:anti-sigma regulatory factor (Ser/Thr protein kinase)
MPVLLLSADPAGVRVARRFVRSIVGAVLDAEQLATAELLTSELVTNAVLHGRGEPVLAVEIDAHRLRVAVHDDTPVLPVVRNPGPLAASGRGMQLIESLAARWGVEPDAKGKDVWFEIELAPVSAS